MLKLTRSNLRVNTFFHINYSIDSQKWKIWRSPVTARKRQNDAKTDRYSFDKKLCPIRRTALTEWSNYSQRPKLTINLPWPVSRLLFASGRKFCITNIFVRYAKAF